MGVTLDGWIVQAGANRHLMHATQACKVLPVQMTGYPSANHDADGLTQGSGQLSFLFPLLVSTRIVFSVRPFVLTPLLFFFFLSLWIDTRHLNLLCY